jgi:hypothetical protein
MRPHRTKFDGVRVVAEKLKPDVIGDFAKVNATVYGTPPAPNTT